MKVLVATDAHIYRTTDGKLWTPAIYGYSFWTRYLNSFDSIRIVARTKDVDKLPDKILEVDGPGIELFPIPFYQGPKQLLKQYLSIHKTLKNVSQGCDVAIFRMPSQTASMVLSHVDRSIPIGGEIVYDPTDDLLRKDVNTIIHCLDLITSSKLKKFCLSANGVSYVTENAIQEHYPSYARVHGETKEHFETFYSTITLGEEAFRSARKYDSQDGLTLSFSNVSMNSERKGEPVFLRTIAECRKLGYNISGILIGDGTKRNEFEKLSEALGIAKFIQFTGRLANSEEVREQMMKTDIFVFPTQAEGLPRGILEAMAIGLPVLSTPVGGIPEVINNRYLFSPSDVDGFTKMICHLYDNRPELNEMSLINYKKALSYKNDILQGRRDDFYNKLKSLSIKG